MSNIVHDYIDDYIEKTHKGRQPFFQALRDYAEQNHIYIVKPQVEQFLKTLLYTARPKRILEVGTAIGYSSLTFLSCVPEAHITTIERDAGVLEMAKEHIRQYGAEEQIRCIFGDAGEVLEELQGTYDFIFLDAAKGQYQKHFALCTEKLAPGGVIVTDDVLYMGMTASDTLATKKHSTIVRRLREFLNEICQNQRYETSILPIGDGVAVTYVKK